MCSNEDLGKGVGDLHLPGSFQEINGAVQPLPEHRLTGLDEFSPDLTVTRLFQFESS